MTNHRRQDAARLGRGSFFKDNPFKSGLEPRADRRYNIGEQDMSIRDDLLVDEEGRAELEAFADAGARFVDATDRPFGAQMVCAVAIGTDAILLAVTLFGSRLVMMFPNPVIIFGLELVAAFVIGFFILFSAYKIFRNEVSPDRDIHVDSGVMSGYADDYNRRRQLVGYYFGAFGAIVNTVMWLGLLITRR